MEIVSWPILTSIQWFNIILMSSKIRTDDMISGPQALKKIVFDGAHRKTDTQTDMATL